MKDFNYYSTSTLTRPKKSEYTLSWVYNNGEVLAKVPGVVYPIDMKGKYPDGSVAQLVVDKEAYDKAVTEFNNDSKRLRDEFKNDCRSDMDCDHMSPELWNSIYNNAWDAGHSYGLQEVYNSLDKYVDLANLAIDSIKKNLY